MPPNGEEEVPGPSRIHAPCPPTTHAYNESIANNTANVRDYCDVSRDPEFQPSNEKWKLTKHDKGWRRVVRNFTPSWFSVNMGTGIVSILLFSLPYNGIWLYWISVGIFGLNVALFCVFVALSILRYTLYPGIWSMMIREPVQSMFIGTFPMGFATIIDMMAFVCVPAWGPWAATVAWAFWIFDAVVATACALLPNKVRMLPADPIDLNSVTALWLLPVISTIVAAAAGSIVAGVLPNPQLALGTIIASYILWGIGMPLSILILAVYFQRLALHKFPSRSVIVSVCLPLGPMGQGGYGILRLGSQAQKTFPITKTLDPQAGVILHVIGYITAIILWGFGLAWMFMAIVSLIRCRRFPFTMGWWSFVFPLGVYASSTNLIAEKTPSQFFKILGTILSVSVVIVWLIVSFFTLRGTMRKQIPYAPCLSDPRLVNPRNTSRRTSREARAR
ncbi:hypothetical protein FQN57_004401 [Myotisia sp. PD_48]|nr:hypothetical protein FQN57_004401 [Myotisia sp. PD_48]